MDIKKTLIIDGYTDEPSGLGVPPYIDVYPRIIAGALWHNLGNDAVVHYVTIDEFRKEDWLRRAESYDLVIFIGGVTVPGKYLDGEPITVSELVRFSRLIRKPFKVLTGPITRFGTGTVGGSYASLVKDLKKAGFDEIVFGDIDEYLTDLLLDGAEKTSPWKIRRGYEKVEKYLFKGARIVRQHRRFGHGLIVELETYRGCARWISGGCSFCIEPLYGKPIQRDIRNIVKEVEALYNYGIRDFRIGRQADFYVVGSAELGYTEWPKPDPQQISRLFSGIRSVAPNVRTLHIDNVNPGTIARYPELSLEITKIIVKHHTSGDVAALGIETADPRVAKINNLNTTEEEAIDAIRLINKIGSVRDRNGIPHFLPGINFILGLPGETRETLSLNKSFLERLIEEKMMVRRVNIRRLLVIPGSRVANMKPRIQGKYEKRHTAFIRWVRNVFDKHMLSNVYPRGTLIKDVYIEKHTKDYSMGRPPGSYPPTIKIPGDYPYMAVVDVVIERVSTGRSISGRIHMPRNLWC